LRLVGNTAWGAAWCMRLADQCALNRTEVV
jgi:hypothetical protein